MPIFGFCAGDDARENGDFETEKPRLQGSKIFNGGDVDENRHFIEGKLVAHGQKFSILKNFCHVTIRFYLHKEYVRSMM